MSLYIVDIDGELPKQGYLSKAKKLDISVSQAINELWQRYEFGKNNYAVECPEYVAALKMGIDAIEYRFKHEGKRDIKPFKDCGNCKYEYARIKDDYKEYYCEKGYCLPCEVCENYEERGADDPEYRI